MKMNKIKEIAKHSGLSWIYNKWRGWRDESTCNRFECSIGDILLQRDVPSNNQLLLTSRLMDVEAYLSGENKCFPFQNTISRKAYGDKHREADGNKAFQALIESYLKDGYHSDSYITCDRDMHLLDGNHRMGLHIYEKIEKVNVRRIRRAIPFPYGSDWYYRIGLPTDFMETLYHRFDEIQKWLLFSGNTFAIWLKIVKEEDSSILKDIGRVCNVLNINKLNGGGYFVQFSMPNPQYQVNNNKLESRRAIDIESIIRKRTKGDCDFIVSNNCLEGKEMWLKAKSNGLF